MVAALLAMVVALVTAAPAWALAPANDPFAAAEVLVGESGAVAGTNVDATKEAGEPNNASNVGGASI